MKIKPAKYDFDDILIEPEIITEINSRYKDIILPKILPLFTAPMDTVVNLKNMDVFLNNGINVVLPRTINTWNLYFLEEENSKYNNVFIGLGLQDIKYHLNYDNIMFIHKDAHILLDVANGHMQQIIGFCQKIKAKRPDIVIMVGNIANPETYRWYAENECVDYIRVGIGNGGGCLTTKQSGVGFPMASLINETYNIKQEMIRNKAIAFNHMQTADWNNENIHEIKNYPKIVADGGMKDYSDIVKALALGADFVMIGSIFNKSLESCADNYFHGIKVNEKIANWLFNHGYIVKKYFRGMSTKQAQKAMGKTKLKTSEGVIRFRKVEYHLDGWIANFQHYLRNAMSYTDCKTLDEFIGKGNIIQITERAYERFNK